MTGSNPEGDSEEAAARRSVWPLGLITGVVVGVAVGFSRGDVATSAGTAVALGISFAFLAPLVRELLTKKKSDDAAPSSTDASQQEHDEK